MAKLSSGARAKLPKKEFAGPGRSFPVEDRGHAEAALFDVGKALKAEHITAEEAAHIRSEAHRKLKSYR